MRLRRLVDLQVSMTTKVLLLTKTAAVALEARLCRPEIQVTQHRSGSKEREPDVILAFHLELNLRSSTSLCMR